MIIVEQRGDSWVVVNNQTGDVLRQFPFRSFNKSSVKKIADKFAAEAERIPEGIVQTSFGNFQDTNTGQSYATLEEAMAAKTESDRVAGLEEDVSKFEDRITEAGRLREELAANRGARTQGQLLNQLTRAILGSGGEMSQVEALTPRIQEASQRSLQDYITESQATTQQQLAQFVPTEIGAEYNQARLQDAMSQFMMNEETQRAQIQAQLDSQPEWWESILGSAGSAAGAALGAKAVAALSDRRMKKSISEVGRLHNGLPVYVFTYKGGTKPQIGVMAQDVEKVNQDAVIEINGIKMVNYEKAVQ